MSKRAYKTISDAAKYAKEIGSDKSFSDLAKEYKQTSVKYDRPAVFRANYGDETNKVGTPLASTYYKDPSGIERFFTAAPPTLSQLGGDIKRAFTGYNKLSYNPNSSGTPTTTGGTIEREPGILANLKLSPLSFIPGANMLMGGIDTLKDIFGLNKPVIRTGGSVTSSVTEEPLSQGVVNTEVVRGNIDPVIPEFVPVDNPALYGDGTFFDQYNNTMASLGITPELLPYMKYYN